MFQCLGTAAFSAEIHILKDSDSPTYTETLALQMSVLFFSAVLKQWKQLSIVFVFIFSWVITLFFTLYKSKDYSIWGRGIVLQLILAELRST